MNNTNTYKIMTFNSTHEMMILYNNIKEATKLNSLDRVYNDIDFSLLNKDIANMLKEIIELKAENLKLKGFEKTN